MSERGRFITLEGGEGVGKSTQLAALADNLRDRGIDVVTTREPGGSPGAEAIRSLLLAGEEDRWSAEAEALLFAAARTDHLDKVVRPALMRGQWVLCDRFVDSSLAYQGCAGGLGIDRVRTINAFGIGDAMPDRTLLMMAPDAAARSLKRDGGVADRIGGRSSSYHAAVDAGFAEVAAAEPARVRVIDCAGPREDVTARLLLALEDLL